MRELTRDEAREWALKYIRCELRSRSPGVILAAVGSRCGPEEPGVDFERGLVVIGGEWPEGREWIRSIRELSGHHFQAADLLRDAQSGQLPLFLEARHDAT